MSHKKIIGTSVPDVDLSKADSELTRKERIAKTQATKGWSSQGVYDEQGRQRFHGAFTGGFSAGYYNTVGSKEGFTPKSYYSSREERATPIAQSITDFMDAEDLADMDFGGRSGGRLKIASDFVRNKPDSRLETSQTGAQSSVPLLVPFDLISHGSDTVGYRLLKLMGWTEGRAVGPKRLAQTEEEEMSPHRFDTKMAHFDDKSNTFGLGYDPLSFSSELGVAKKPIFQQPKRSSRMEMSSQFGGDEDDMIYGSVSRSHAAFDEELDLDGEEESFVLNMQPSRRKTAPKQDKKERRGAPKGLPSGIPGFVRALYAPVNPAYFPPPQVPASFNPNHQFPSDGHFEATEDRFAPRSVLTSTDRSRLLGEQSLPASSSVPPNTKLSQEKPSPLVSAPTTAATIPSLKSRFTSDLSPPPTPTSQSPYSTMSSPATQPAMTSTTPLPPRPSTVGMLSNAMAKRFVSTKDKSSVEPEEERSQKEGTEMQHDAARAGMFGQLTRRIEEWTPSSLLCKRMSIHNPVRVSRFQPLASTTNVVNKATRESAAELLSPTFLAMASATSSAVSNWRLDQDRQEKSVEPEKKIEDAMEVKAAPQKEDADENAPLPAIQRPPMDLFKSIFEDDEGDEDDDEGDVDSTPAEPKNTEKTTPGASESKQFAESFFERLAQDIFSSKTPSGTEPIDGPMPKRVEPPAAPFEGPSLPSLPPAYSYSGSDFDRKHKKEKHKHKSKHKDKHKRHHSKDRSKTHSKKRSRYSSDSDSSSADESAGSSSPRREKRHKYRD